LANQTGRQPEEGRNLGILQSRQSKIHTVLRAKNVKKLNARSLRLTMWPLFEWTILSYYEYPVSTGACKVDIFYIVCKIVAM